jgi:hypothetical protein
LWGTRESLWLVIIERDVEMLHALKTTDCSIICGSATCLGTWLVCMYTSICVSNRFVFECYSSLLETALWRRTVPSADTVI